MGKLTERLQDASRSGVYRVTRADEVAEAAAGLALARIRFDTKDALLRNIAAALRFPDWFGRNWDALEDCLCDLQGGGHVLVFDQAQPGEDLGVLIEVLRSSAEQRAASGKPFFAVFVDPGRALPLPDLFRER
jgi:RNAse (barnase) inhibitor barstar